MTQIQRPLSTADIDAAMSEFVDYGQIVNDDKNIENVYKGLDNKIN